MSNRRFVPIVLLAAALLLFTIGVVNADLIVENVWSWDDKLTGGQNPVPVGWSHDLQQLRLNADRQPFYAQLSFDNDIHADACGADNDSAWAGDNQIGLFHTDSPNDSSAPGFQSTTNWGIVPCSVLHIQPNQNVKKFAAPGDYLAHCVQAAGPGGAEDGGCIISGTPDRIDSTLCGGNCTNEIVTDFHVNLDAGVTQVSPLVKDPNLACDGTADPVFAPYVPNPAVPSQNLDLCMYWEAVKPPNTAPFWGGNLQVRYAAGGGQRTINFTEMGPNAVTLSDLSATAGVIRGSLAAWALGLVLVGAAVFVWRRKA